MSESVLAVLPAATTSVFSAERLTKGAKTARMIRPKRIFQAFRIKFNMWDLIDVGDTPHAPNILARRWEPMNHIWPEGHPQT